MKQLKTQEQQQQPQEGAMVEIPHDYLIDGVKQSVGDIMRLMKEMRVKHGPRYNEKNDFEEFGRRFGYDDAERIWAEFDLVWNKRSKEPSSVRKVVRLIGDSARYYAVERMRREAQASGEAQGEKKDG